MKPSLIPDGKISRAVREGIALREKLLADGMDEQVADTIVGQGLKAAWSDSVGQSGRHWGYYCNTCRDTGWRMVPGDEERWKTLYGADAVCPDFARKCEPCNWQNRERELRAKTKAMSA